MNSLRLWVVFLIGFLKLSIGYAQLIPVYVGNGSVQYYLGRPGDVPEGRSDGKLYADPPEVNDNSLSVVNHHIGQKVGGEVYWPNNGDEGSSGNEGGDISPPVDQDTSDLAQGSSNNNYIGHAGWGWGTPVLGHVHHGSGHHHSTKVYHYKVIPAKQHGWQHAQKHNQYHIGWEEPISNGWGWGIKSFGHDVLDTVDGWFGWKNWDMSKIKQVAKTVGIAVPFVAGMGLLLFMMPIPVIIQAVARSRVSSGKVLEEASSLAGNVLKAEECIERITCQFTEFARKYHNDTFIEKIWRKLPPTDWAKRISKAGELVMESYKRGKAGKLLSVGGNERKCESYVCNPGKRILDYWKNT